MNATTALSMVLADEFARCGVDDVVVCPGARSAPLARALFTTAASTGQRLHTRFDERSAGFLAVGLAKRSRRPVVVVCTSGTACANLHPAVLEASHAHLPIVVLTADRPPELRGTGASQTTDQIKLFGGAVTLFTEVGAPPAEPLEATRSNAYWRSLVCRAVEAATEGPVHLNVALREPLDFAPAAVDPRFEGRPGRRPWIEVAAVTSASPTDLGDLAGARGVVVVGDDAADPQAAAAFAETAGWPLLAEPHSGARIGPMRSPATGTCWPTVRPGTSSFPTWWSVSADRGYRARFRHFCVTFRTWSWSTRMPTGRTRRARRHACGAGYPRRGSRAPTPHGCGPGSSPMRRRRVRSARSSTTPASANRECSEMCCTSCLLAVCA